MAGFRLITLDLDDTLWPCAPVIQAAEQSLYGWLQQHAPRVAAAYDIAGLRDHRKALAAARPALAHDLTALRLTQLELLLTEHGHDPALAEAGSQHFRTARNRVTPYPEVREALARLRRDYLLVSLTNGNAQVEQTPLAGCFHHSLSAAEVGAAKPDPALFLAACEWARVTPPQALHVGDDPLRDVAAARELGMAGAWLNRGAAVWPQDLAAPQLQFADLTALAAALTTGAQASNS
jgi:2-haloalkanoic acid dehalogenase type II